MHVPAAVIPKQGNGRSSNVAAFRNALWIMRTLCRSNVSISYLGLARRVGLSKSSTERLVASLIAAGWPVDVLKDGGEHRVRVRPGAVTQHGKRLQWDIGATP
jgi:DNA-binding IclR family transcriptional regulator